MADLVSSDNLQGRITNSDIELSELVLQEATFPSVITNLTWGAPFTGNNKTITVAWTFQEASTVKTVVADLIRLLSLVNC